MIISSFKWPITSPQLAHILDTCLAVAIGRDDDREFASESDALRVTFEAAVNDGKPESFTWNKDIR